MGSGVAVAWAADQDSWATVSRTLGKAARAVPPLRWRPHSLVPSVWHPCLPCQVARGGFTRGGPGGWEGRPGTPHHGRLHRGEWGPHWGRKSPEARPAGDPASWGWPPLCPRRTHPPGWGPARSTSVHCSWGLAWGWVRAKSPGAVGRHEPQAGLRLPPGRAPNPGRVCAAPRASRPAWSSCTGVCTCKSQGGARCPGLRAPPRPRGPQSKQGLHRWSLPAGGRDSTPGVDAGLVSGEGDPPRPTLAAGLSLGLRDTATAPAPRPPLSAGTPRTQHPDLS